MGLPSIILIVLALGAALVLLHPALLRRPLWRATVTPLASIIGSGFLVAAPILSDAAGRLAWLAMFGLCAIGLLFGTAIRFNIRHVEPKLAKDPTYAMAIISRLSGLALAFAYFISVAYYLNLFSAFGLRIFGIEAPVWINATTTTMLALLALLGFSGGLHALERLEAVAVGIKLSVIFGLFGALIAASLFSVGDGSFSWPLIEHERGWNELRVLGGLVILVQGFETSRYLSAEYDDKTRSKTMLWAQILATAIYVAFILLATPYFGTRPQGAGGETAIIDMLAPLGLALAPALILGALASQLSASVADMNGAGGLLAENLGKFLSVRRGYLVTALAAAAVTWGANIYEIISYASRAFVLYYALQCLQALLAARRLPLREVWPRMILFAAGIALAIAILIFAIPASA